jgi:hypothetical protein
MKELFIKYKKIFISVGVICVLLIGYNLYNNYKTQQQIQQNKIQIENKQKAIDTKKAMDKVVSDYKNEADKDNSEADKQLADLDKYRLIIKETKEENYSNGYHDVKVIVENVASENVGYVKVGLNFKDENGKVVQSDNITDNNIIKPNAQQTLTKRISNDIKYKTVEPEIEEVKVNN